MMNRRDFVKMCALLGLSLPFQAACGGAGLDAGNIDKVLIIGAGAGGMAAGYLLQQQGIDFQILEASSTYGGRMKQTTNFADFPIPLGAEWIHVEADILQEIVNDESVDVAIETTQYDFDVDYALYEGEELSLDEIFTIDSKFINSTWFDFFERYIVPSIADRITYNAVVREVDYSAETIQVRTQNETFSADRVIINVPVKLLQNGAVIFTPPLPQDKQNAIDNVTVWDGCKAFIQFTEKFWPAAVAFEIAPETAGQKLYYDASYGQNTNQHVLGLFAVGTGTLPYVNLSDDELIAYILNELDELSGGQATPNYVKYVFQNWNAEPYANGAYIYDHEDWRRVHTLGESVAGRLFFAGSAYTDGEDWSSVHTAASSARRAIDEMLGG